MRVCGLHCLGAVWLVPCGLNCSVCRLCSLGLRYSWVRDFDDALKLAQKSKSDSLSFGWHRAEIIGTLISVCTMWIMTIWLVVEATHRFYEEPEVEGLTMLIVAIISLFFNLIQIYILH